MPQLHVGHLNISAVTLQFHEKVASAQQEASTPLASLALPAGGQYDSIEN